jgi:cytochrome c biogenesis protein CcmG, thiol:disulfide interchange protein DsbE
MSLRTIRILLWLPLVAFLIVLALVSSGLIKPHDATVRSRMVGQMLPAFSLPSVRGGEAPVAVPLFTDGKPRLLNFFASWCVPCAAEAPQLMQLKQAGVPIIGIATRDLPADTLDYLRRNGDPYARIGRDDTSSLQVALGSSGVPETFMIDGKGVIRAQHIGGIGPGDVADLLAQFRDAR